MSQEKGQNKKKKERKKIERLKRLLGIDLCACGGNQLKCHGICRERHTNTKTGVVQCTALYQIDQSEVQQSGSNRPKRGWHYGHQKEGNENKDTKQIRREKMNRDRV